MVIVDELHIKRTNLMVERVDDMCIPAAEREYNSDGRSTDRQQQ